MQKLKEAEKATTKINKIMILKNLKINKLSQLEMDLNQPVNQSKLVECQKLIKINNLKMHQEKEIL